MPTWLRVVGALVIVWLGALVFAPQVVPSFLVPPGVKIRAGGGGDDQPPIIISDGSVMLLTRGQWADDGNATTPHFVSENNSTDVAAASMTVLVDGGVGSNGVPANCPSDTFDTADLTLYSGSVTHDLEVDLVNGDAYNGKLRINHGDEKPKTKHRIDLGGSLASVTRLTANNGAVDCSFPTLGSREFILVVPHR
jgi:hypothetical protein